MSLEPVPRKSAEALRQDAVNALRLATALVEPYVQTAGFLERRPLIRHTRDAVFETQLQGFLSRLEAFNRHVLSQDQAFYSEQLFTDLVACTSRVTQLLEDLGTSDNAFAEAAAKRLFETWMRGVDRLLAAHGF